MDTDAESLQQVADAVSAPRIDSLAALHSELQALTHTSERLLQQIIDLHGRLLALAVPAQGPALQRQIDALFQQSPPRTEATPLVAYRPVVPGISFGFEAEAGLQAQVMELPAPERAGQNRLAIDVLEPGTSRWFTLEIETPWPELRSTRRCTVRLAATSNVEVGCRLVLRADDVEGGQHELGSGDIRLAARAAVTSASFDFVLPHNIRFNEDVAPKLLLFFELARFRAELDYFQVTLD